MNSSLTDSSDPSLDASHSESPRNPLDVVSPAGPENAIGSLERAEPRNFLVLIVYQVLMRTGWIFKTESIIMPFVLDTLGGPAWVRGLLPLFNRFGQSIPPLLVARRVTVVPQKKWLLVLSTALMSASFLGLAGIWAVTGGRYWWMQLVFLAVYLVFFTSTGIHQLVLNTLQGKLIEATHRGRLMLLSSLFGAAVAIGCVLLLLPGWLSDENVRFVPLFGFTGLCFGLCAVSGLLLVERPDRYEHPPMKIRQLFSSAWRTLNDDPNFRRLALVAASFSASTMLFPHYQALGRGGRLELPVTHLLWWVVLQNAGTALFSFIAGPLADARGNRMVLRLLMLALCMAPLSALGVAHFGQGMSSAYALVFVLVGMTPVGIRILNNYTLEVSAARDHPRYLSTLSLCMAAPILASPLVGWGLDLVGFEAVFLFITSVVFTGWLLSGGLREPRHGSQLPG